MAKMEQRVRKYTYFTALLTSVFCGAVALGINVLIKTEHINHEFEALFAPVAVGIALCLINFKVLSKLSLFLLPPAMGFLGIGVVIGPFLASQMGVSTANVGETTRIIIQSFPFLIVATFVYKWYAGLAGKRSFITYAFFSIGTAVTSLLIFREGLDFEWIISGYLAFTALAFSRLHVGSILG